MKRAFARFLFDLTGQWDRSWHKGGRRLNSHGNRMRSIVDPHRRP
jgi:hypothetical protein